jgi:hypothetical protein
MNWLVQAACKSASRGAHSFLTSQSKPIQLALWPVCLFFFLCDPHTELSGLPAGQAPCIFTPDPGGTTYLSSDTISRPKNRQGGPPWPKVLFYPYLERCGSFYQANNGRQTPKMVVLSIPCANISIITHSIKHDHVFVTFLVQWRRPLGK